MSTGVNHQRFTGINIHEIHLLLSEQEPTNILQFILSQEIEQMVKQIPRQIVVQEKEKYLHDQIKIDISDTKPEFRNIIIQNFICSICHTVFIDPVECDNCSQIYCTHCITTWQMKKDMCPICSHQPINLIKMNPKMMSVIEQIEFSCSECNKCCNLKKSQKLAYNLLASNINCEQRQDEIYEECKGEPKYYNYKRIMKHKKKCPFYIYYCPNQCSQIPFRTRDMFAHLQGKCPNQISQCLDCGENNAIKFLKLHDCVKNLLEKNQKISQLLELFQSKENELQEQVQSSNLNKITSAFENWFPLSNSLTQNLINNKECFYRPKQFNRDSIYDSELRDYQNQQDQQDGDEFQKLKMSSQQKYQAGFWDYYDSRKERKQYIHGGIALSEYSSGGKNDKRKQKRLRQSEFIRNYKS
ncbi:traf-type zinc finger family protein [Stylonychia lemnae]|uniref:Traf-type zinc finger family protein n=1 Tax=Stylonychia lemnae TaxID=5949 RepID=A0A078B8G0_STYLE|nr:traf-type zinc finger family protein [Stylonychia lemnae]|eukprot:CDW89843.1 traf-type zinc finger family protein [Stylonychia lemnae]